ncbi:ABC transporter permease [Leekyejoonella antrihumi]|uniref:ABC transporter permease n=1 Tax=Leekyejoonella antrihumi TaxID=1660198 RepID=A0A563DZT7_9MICO|nr:ABC transporter permease [Leekyejoonella antrihumi]TWP35788.1 ABC transporter permease [Leekyejoonella antrihumi]
MIRFTARRLAIVIASLFASTLIVFAILAVLPGSTAQVILGTQATPDSVRALNQQLGLDKPLWQQYGNWLQQLVTGNLGTSYISQQQIGEQITQALRVTGPLVLFGMLIGLAIAFPAGIIGALRSGQRSGALVGAASQVGIAIPTFVGGILLIIIFPVKLHLLPASGFPGWSNPGQAIESLILPAVTLGLVEGAIISRYVRASISEVLQSDYLRTARAKGLTPGQALRRHGLRNALIPIVTVVGLELTGLIIGAIVVENVFTLPGLGQLLLQSVANRDLLMVRDIVMIVAAAVLIINMLVDLSYRVLDPRVMSRV